MVERHEDGYHGPHSVKVARTLPAALELAREEREWFTVVDSWKPPKGRECNDGYERMTWYARGTTAWVTIRNAELHG